MTNEANAGNGVFGEYVDTINVMGKQIDALHAERDQLRTESLQKADEHTRQTNELLRDREAWKKAAGDQRVECAKLTAERDQLKAELEEQKQSFDLYWKASQRGIKAYQEKHGITDGSWPDHADLICWLMEQIDELSEEADDLENENGLVHDCNDGNRETIVNLTAERDALAERVKALEGDGEIGRLVRELLEKNPSPEVITIARKAHDCYALTAPSIRYASFLGDTLLQALKGGE